MDLCRRQRGGRVVAREVLVVRAPVRRVPEADRAPGRGQVLVAEHGLEAAIGGDHGFRNHLLRFRGEPLSVGRRDRVGVGAETLEERAVLGLVRDLFRQRLQHAFHDGARLRALFRGPAAQEVPILVEEGRDRPHAAQPGLVVGHRLERHQLGELVQRLRAAARLDRVVLGMERQRGLARLVFVPEQVVVELLCGRQPLARNAGEIVEDLRVGCIPRRFGGRGDVRQPVVVAWVAEVGGRQRVVREVAFPFAIEECVQVGDGIRGCGDRRRREHTEDEDENRGRPGHGGLRCRLILTARLYPVNAGTFR